MRRLTFWSGLGVAVAYCALAVGLSQKPATTELPQTTKIDLDTFVAGPTQRRIMGPVEITNIMTYAALHFDPIRETSAAIAYSLSRPSWVRIRFVSRVRPNLVLRTLLDWSYRKAGRNTENWDGRDAAGYWVDRVRCPGMFVIEADSALHAGHDRRVCGDPQLRIGGLDQGAVVRGAVTMQVGCATGKCGYLERASGRLLIYLDYVLVREQRYPPPATRTLDWEWNTADVLPGNHLLTVNLDDGLDHVGTASVEVAVRP